MTGRDLVMLAIGGAVSIAVFVFMWSLGAAAHRGDEMTSAVLRRHKDEVEP